MSLATVSLFFWPAQPPAFIVGQRHPFDQPQSSMATDDSQLPARHLTVIHSHVVATA